MKNKALFALISVGLLLGGIWLLQKAQTTQIKDNTNTIIKNIQPTTEPQTKNTLNLSNQNLQKIQGSVFSQKELQKLDVSNNQLTGSIQAEIRQLQNLIVLDMSNNQLTGVPAEIGQLKNLQVLDLSNNQLTGLPYELGNLQNLKTLNISGNDYSELDLNIILGKLPVGVNIIK